MSRFVILIAAVVVIGLDQFSKQLAASRLPLSVNSGISFGMFQAVPGIIWLFFLGLILIWLWISWRGSWEASPVGAGLFFGGAVSNMLDRVRWEGVRDWLPVPFTNIHNNLADWGVILGLAMVFWVAFQQRTKVAELKAANPEQHD